MIYVYVVWARTEFQKPKICSMTMNPSTIEIVGVQCISLGLREILTSGMEIIRG